MPRMFALLEHTTRDGVHWDLLIEYAPGSPLAAWRLLANPLDADLPIAAERIADHRRAYLTYEGPISADRGSVRRLDHGAASLSLEAEDVQIHLRGNHLYGEFALRTNAEGLHFNRAP